jgi:hypothetical protein
MPGLESQLKKIGRNLVADAYEDCDDVECSKKNGIVPRGLVYEHSEMWPRSTGVVIVGMNPGAAESDERMAMRKDPTYEGFLKYFWDKIATKAYYVKLKELAHVLGLRGPIVWTELVKCQSKQRGKLSIATVRRDVNKYLFEELKLVPPEWPLIGVGYDAYKILSYSFPNRIVIGVPHVKAHGGYFYGLLRRDNPKTSAAKHKLQTALKKKNHVLVSLFGKG